MKCEHCPDFERKTVDGPVGWCHAHNCARKLNDSCTEQERLQKDDWGG